MSDPTPILPLQYATPETNRDSGSTKAVRGLARLCWVLALLGTIAMFIEVESVILTGPLLATAGGTLLGLSISRRDKRGRFLATAHVFVCFIFFILVAAFSWSPGDAREPFQAMSIVYTLATAWPTLRIVRPRPAA